MGRNHNRKGDAAGLTLVAIFLMLGWYAIAANYDYSALAGTYEFKGDGIVTTLVLFSDTRFHQEILRGGQQEIANGHWHRYGMAGVGFSREFLRLPGAKTFIEEFGKGYGTPDDLEFCGQFERIGGLYPTLRLNADPPGPEFYWKPFGL